MIEVKGTSPPGMMAPRALAMASLIHPRCRAMRAALVEAVAMPNGHPARRARARQSCEASQASSMQYPVLRCATPS